MPADSREQFRRLGVPPAVGLIHPTHGEDPGQSEQDHRKRAARPPAAPGRRRRADPPARPRKPAHAGFRTATSGRFAARAASNARCSTTAPSPSDPRTAWTRALPRARCTSAWISRVGGPPGLLSRAAQRLDPGVHRARVQGSCSRPQQRRGDHPGPQPRAAAARDREPRIAAPAMGQAPRVRTSPRTTPDALMPARRARPPRGPAGRAPARRRPADRARPRARPQPSRPRRHQRPADSALAGVAPACPGPRSAGGPAATTYRTPGNSAARSPPGGHRLCPPTGSEPSSSARTSTHSFAGRHAQRVAAQQRGQAETAPQIRQRPAQRTQRVIRLAEQLARQLTPPDRTSGQRHPGQHRPGLGRAAAGTAARRPRCEETRAAVPAVSPPVNLSPGPRPGPGPAERGHLRW